MISILRTACRVGARKPRSLGSSLSLNPRNRVACVALSATPVKPLFSIVRGDDDNAINVRQFSSSSLSSPYPSSSASVRLSKLISQYSSNFAISRREAERLIKQGEVTFAGDVISYPSQLILWKDIVGKGVLIKVSGKAVHIIPPTEFETNKGDGSNNNKADSLSPSLTATKVWIANKLSGEVVTERDPLNRPSLIDRLMRSGVGSALYDKNNRKHHIKPIGRLDVPTEGLILLTNDGDYARSMELPSSKLHRTYKVRVHGKLTPTKLHRIRNGGVIHDGIRYNSMKVIMEKQKFGSRSTKTPTNTWLRVTCTEGKNRQIRNVFASLGCEYMCAVAQSQICEPWDMKLIALLSFCKFGSLTKIPPL